MGRRILLLGGLAMLAAAAPAGASPRLARFHSCDGLVSYARQQAMKTGGLPSRFAPVPAPMAGAPGPVPVAPPPSTASGQGAIPAPAAPSATAEATRDYSGTNVQEAGIDEPDIVKTDGSRVFAIVDATLFAVDGRASAPRLLGSLKLGPGWSYQLLLHGKRLLVLYNAPSTTTATAASAPFVAPDLTFARITEVDVSDPAAMRIVRSERVDGSYVSARVTGHTARVVVSSSPRAIPLPLPAAAPPSARAEARRRNRASIRRAGLAGWVPAALINDRRMRRRTLRPAVSCRRVLRTAAFSGSGMLTVLTIDLDKGLPAVDTDGLMTDAQTVYASDRSLYVATQRWSEPTTAPTRVPSSTRTSIHQFDASDPGSTTYLASGDVPGVLLNQFALSEYRGYLRVASTDTPAWVGTVPPGPSDNLVTVLKRRDRTLTTAGKVEGMGRGERIYAVRFIDDVAYVVTFRRIDPLYTVDLSDPAKPRVAGELELLGYSAYLHPVGKDRLLGVGQTAGRASGTQLSLFDTSDLAKPRLLAQRALGAGSSEVEFDHHAFLYWPATKLAVIPLTEWRDTRFAGLVGFRIDPAGQITEVGRVSDELNGWFRPITRSLVMGERLFALSDEALLARRLDTLGPLARVPFGIEHPAPPPGGPFAAH